MDSEALQLEIEVLWWLDAKVQLLTVEQCGCLYFSNYYILHIIPVLIATKTTWRMKKEWKRGECRRKSPSPKEVRELCQNAQYCLFTIVIIRVWTAFGPIQKSFLEIMDPSYYHGVIFVLNEVQLWLFGCRQSLCRRSAFSVLWLLVRTCEGEIFCLLVVFTHLWFRQPEYCPFSWSPFLCGNVTCLLGLFLCASRWGNAFWALPFPAWLSNLAFCLIPK